MTETARLVIAVDSTQVGNAGADLSALERQAAKTEIGIMELAKAASKAYGALKLGSVITDAVTLSARYDQLGIVMSRVGQNTGRSTVELAALDQELQKAGISALQSRNNIIKMMSANIDLAQATKLARLAQDAAVIGNTNSSEAFERLIKGIQSAEKETLETLGLNVNFQQSYEKLAAQLGKNADQLTTAEKTQAGVNAAMEAGKNIAGAYEDSLGNANKALQSTTRYVENLMIKLGAPPQGAFKSAVDSYSEALQALDKNADVVIQVLETGLYAALGRGVAAAYTSAAAFAVETKAKQSSATAALALAEAEAIEAAANLKATTKRYAAYASHVEVTAATNADAAAQLRLAAAHKESSVAGTAAIGVGGRLLGLMGGQLGLAVTAGAVALSFVDWSKSANDAKRSAVDLSPSIEALTEKWVKLGAAQRTALGNDLQQELTESKQKILDLSAQVEKSYNDMGNVKGLPIESWLAPLREFRAAAANGGEGIGDFTQALLDGVPVGSEFRVKVEELAAKIEREHEIALKASEGLKILEEQTRNNTAANAALSGSTDQVGQKYLEQLKKQADFAGKLTEVEKVRISIAKGYAGTLSETDQKAALAYAETVDKANAATAATKTLTSETNKHATAVENQAKALKDFEAQSAISTKSSNDMADAYLAGADSVRELAIQQKIEEELLKAGAGARKEVEAAIRGQADAEDRLAAAKSAYDLGKETEDILAQATATLQGTAALEAYNVQKAMQVALAGKNVAVGSQEYEHLLAATKAQQEAVKIAKQASDAGGIMDRLYPEKKLLREYTEAQAALNQAMQLAPDKAAEYQDALRLLGLEYEQNKNAATAWGKFTEGALDRVDGAFADAWKNIGDGFDGFATSLKDGFKQLLAELAHMAITRPIVMQIGAALGVGGLSAQSGGGGGLSSPWDIGTKAYGVATSGFGSAVSAGWSAGEGFLGGMQSAISGGYNYVSSGLSGLFSSGASGAMVNGTYQMGASAAPATVDLIGNTVTKGGQVIGTPGGLTTGPGTSALGGTLAGIGGALYGYGQSGLKGAATGAAGGVGGYYAGAALGSLAGPIGTAIGGIVGSTLGSFLGGSLFGGDWVTKDMGLSLAVNDGDFYGRQYEYQKKKGGLFSSNKKRTRYSALDPEMQAALDATYDATEGAVLDLFDRLNVELNDGVLDGLNIGAQEISTKDKTAEEIQAEITKWFGSVADSMVSTIDAATEAGLGGYNFEGLTAFVQNLEGVNEVIRYLNKDMYETSVAGGKLAEQLSAIAGGFDVLKANAATYYGAFIGEAERMDDTLDAVTRAFEAANQELPKSRAQFRDVVESIDTTSQAGMEMFATLMALSGQASSYYDILEQRAGASVNTAFAAVQRAVAAQQKAINKSLTDANSRISDLTGISNALDNALKQLRGTGDDAVRMLRSQAQATLTSALAIARAGGSLAGFAGLTDALDVLGSNNTDLYGSLEEFNRDQGRTANAVAELNKLNGKQLSAAEKNALAMQAQLDALDAQLEFAQAQVDALNGIDNSVKSVAEAVKAMNSTVVAALQVQPKGAAQANTPQNNQKIVDTIYSDVLGRGTVGDEAGAAFWANALQSGTATYQDVAESIAKAALGNSAESLASKQAALDYLNKNGLPAYASGGLITGPGTGTSDSIIARLSNGEYVMSADAVRMFGTGLLDQMNAGRLPAFAQGGPVLDIPSPVQAFGAGRSAEQSGSGTQGSALLDEVRQLRAENRQAQFQLVKLTQRLEQTITQWDVDGAPPERSYA